MDQFSFNHLNDTEFEQFGYDLLVALGFSSVNWRKGTGLATSPADSGRDLECQLIQRRIDDEPYVERWFVECKHYQKGVPVDALTGALAWASSERPDTLLIIASNFLSNSTKDYIDKYNANNKPTYKIVIWERPKLEKLTATHSLLLKKYRLSGDYPFLALLHPSHIACLQDMPINTLKYFLDCLDELPPEKRDAMFGTAYLFLIQPRYRKAVTGKETMAELEIDRVDYAAFKQRCHQIIQTGMMSGLLLTYLIITFTLNELFGLGDTTKIDDNVTSMAHAAKFFQSQIEKRPQEKDHLEKMVANAQHHQKEIPARIKANYSLYCYFCENVLEKLRMEKYLRKCEPPADQEQEYEDAVQFYRKELE
ncbi:hypothetical protein KDW_31180 [Dictyobacter vulcani]|uniref:Restriction endonuclease type IV Mrr domain-containing protein n=1 Tax=Dictyobacter vulcani TaxID=2607529 RepID=A0A5J4KUP4_9CHLR|nr:restriction endonuclease [Dictyobacter vulcani]GER88956.1 hypothetical protein KDW_31180 [Dictyobacter vulcani]